MRRRDGDVKLVVIVVGSCDGVPELSGGLRWVRCRVFVNSQNVFQDSLTASAIGWNVDGKRSLFRATAFDEARRCDRGPHVQEQLCFHVKFFVCWKTTLKSRKTSSEALVVALRRSTDNSRTLSPCKSGGPMRPLAGKGVPREAQEKEKQHGLKKRSENGALTCAGAASCFLEQAT